MTESKANKRNSLIFFFWAIFKYLLKFKLNERNKKKLQDELSEKQLFHLIPTTSSD